jgi:hypothetical protein
METLGLSSPPAERSNIFRRIFWPENHAGNADSLAQQGFWVCLVIAAFSCGMLIYSGHPFFALLSFVFYALGGVGVREYSVIAAAAVSGVWVFQIFVVLALRQMPGLPDIAAAIVLLTNIRGAWIASNWKRTGAPDMFPDRLNETWRDKLSDQLPQKIWPIGKFVFIASGVLWLTLNVVGLAIILARSHH